MCFNPSTTGCYKQHKSGFNRDFDVFRSMGRAKSAVIWQNWQCRVNGTVGRWRKGWHKSPNRSAAVSRTIGDLQTETDRPVRAYCCSLFIVVLAFKSRLELDPRGQCLWKGKPKNTNYEMYSNKPTCLCFWEKLVQTPIFDFILSK